MKPYCLTLGVALLAAAFACQAQQQAPWKIWGTTSESQFSTIGNTNVFSNGVIVSNQSTVVSANQAIADNLTGDVQAEGDVTIVDNNHIWRGTNAVYNFRTGQVYANAFKSVQAPFRILGQELTGSTSNKIYTATNVFITTDDYPTAAYKIRARHITIVLNQYFEAYDATLMVGSVPIFYYPHYKRYFGRHPNFWDFTPGDRSSFGPYFFSAYHWYGNEYLDGVERVDLRERRGVAAGQDLNLHMGQAGDAAFQYYYAHDQDPTVDSLSAPHLNDDRQRMRFAYQATPTSNLTATVLANYQSDPLIIRDFFESEYRGDIQPKSFAEVDQLWPNFTLDAMAQPRLVNFFDTVERLPDIKLTGLRQEVGTTPIYYESESSAGYFRQVYADTNGFNTTNFFTASDYSAMRADTFHQFTLPETFFGWLNVTPRVGGRMTYYSSVSGPSIKTNEQVRGVFNTGADVSMKLSRVWPSAESDFWEVDGLRHIFEPDLNYAFVPSPTRSPSQLPQFDSQLPSLRLLPIEYPDYNSIDSINSQNVMRLTLRNMLQTKRDDGVEDLVNWSVYGDWNLTPGTNHAISDVFSDLDFRPRSWLTLTSENAYDPSHSHLRESVEGLTIQPNNRYSISLSYRYLVNNDPELQTYPGEPITGHNLITASFYYRMNENWATRVAERYEAQDGVLQEQIYTLYRDLRSWTAALTFRVAEGVNQPSDFTVALTFSLKAFPRYKMNSDSDHPTLLMGSETSVNPLAHGYQQN